MKFRYEGQSLKETLDEIYWWLNTYGKELENLKRSQPLRTPVTKKEEILKELKEGKRTKDISRRFKVSQPYVSKLRRFVRTTPK